MPRKPIDPFRLAKKLRRWVAKIETKMRTLVAFVKDSRAET